MKVYLVQMQYNNCGEHDDYDFGIDTLEICLTKERAIEFIKDYRFGIESEYITIVRESEVPGLIEEYKDRIKEYVDRYNFVDKKYLKDEDVLFEVFDRDSRRKSLMVEYEVTDSAIRKLRKGSIWSDRDYYYEFLIKEMEVLE